MKTIFLLLFSSFVMSCAQETLVRQASLDENIIYQPEILSKKKFMACNFFADETFRGYIYRPSSKSSCFHIHITEGPKEFLRNEDLFLQIYPFRIFRDEHEYGFSQTIHTRAKFGEQKILIKSQLIDAHIVQVELKETADHFFLDHTLEICGLDKKWQGLQLVIYERRDYHEEPVPIRITKFLVPPFLIHPEYFRDKKGINIAAFHPFLEHIPDFKSKPDGYYRLAEQMCAYIE